MEPKKFVDKSTGEEIILWNSLNARNRPRNGPTEYPPSLTVPDQSMTPRQIVDRYTRGLSVTGMKTPIYDDENLSSGINPKTLDRVDIENLTRENNQKLETSKGKLAKEKQAKIDRERREAVEQAKKEMDSTRNPISPAEKGEAEKN